MPRYGELENSIVLLTGGANGIGASIVAAFAEQGSTVEFCDLDEPAGKRIERECALSRFTRVNLTKEQQILRWIAGIGKRHSRIDVVVNNAAIDPRIAIDELSAEKFDRLMAVNLRPLFITVREAVKHMRGGAIVNFGSITFHTAPAKMSAYVATKGAVLGATRALARELGPRGIRVNTVSPGWIMTERQLREHVNTATKRLIKQSQCVPELLQPADIAEVVLFLASNASRAITGQEILADRGWAHS